MTVFQRPASRSTPKHTGKTTKALRGKAFDRELVVHIKSLRAFACSLTRDNEKAEDLVQETVLRAISHHSSFRKGTNQRAWLFRILRNVFLAQKRRESAQKNAAPKLLMNSLAGAPSAGGQFDHVLLSEVSQKLLELPPLQRRAITLVGRLGLSYQEAAVVEKCAVGTIKSRVCRARLALGATFGDLCVELNRAPTVDEAQRFWGTPHV